MPKKKNVLVLICLGVLLSCKVPVMDLTGSEGYNLSLDNYRFIDFPNEDNDRSVEFYHEKFAEGGYRIGKIKNNFKEGKWLSGDAGFDEKGNVYSKSYIWREEYFKKGLRDSVFRCFDKNNKVIYETKFKMGTGLWKEFHDNGKVYFEIETKAGYFTDTLKLYNEEGVNFQKRLYQKDTLIYYVGNDNWCLKYRYKPDNNAYLEVDSYNQKDLKQGTFRNTFIYKTKEEFENDYFAKSTLKR